MPNSNRLGKNSVSFHFSHMGLKVTLHKSDHISNWRRSLDNIVCKTLGFLEEHISIVSSANREIEDLMFVPMSLTYTRKSKGPSTDPWWHCSLWHDMTSKVGLPYVRFFSDMSGILVANYASGRNVKKCFNVRDFGIMPFMKSNRNVFTVRITKCWRLKFVIFYY